MSRPNRPIRLIEVTPAASVLPGHVVLYEQTWVHHIAPRHTDVDINDIHTAMIDPCEICASATTAGSFVMVNKNATNQHGDELRVPVKPVGGGTNIVTSAYYGIAPHGTIVWKRGDA